MKFEQTWMNYDRTYGLKLIDDDYVVAVRASILAGNKYGYPPQELIEEMLAHLLRTVDARRLHASSAC